MLGIVTIVGACSSGARMQPADDKYAKAQEKVPGITRTEINQGYKLYIQNCSACHQLHKAEEFTAAKWNQILPEMFGKAKLADENKKTLIRNYLLAFSK